MEDKILNSLFEKARNVPDEVPVNQIQKWIGYGSLTLLLLGILTKFKTVFTLKISIMLSAISSVFVTSVLVFTMSKDASKVEAQLPQKQNFEKQVEKKELSEPLVLEEKIIPRNNEVQVVEKLLPIEQQELQLLTPELNIEIPELILLKEDKVGEFHSIRILGASDVILIQGDKYGVELKGDELGKSFASIENKNGTLILKTDTKGRKNPKYELTFYVTVKQLEEISISGASSITSETHVQFDDLKITSSGASDVKLDVELKALILNTTGASNIDLKGFTPFLDLTCSGASDIELRDFLAEKCNLKCSGASDVKLSVSGTIDIDISGASDFKLYGNPQISTKTVTGASNFRQYR